jgi:hypothetical protein
MSGTPIRNAAEGIIAAIRKNIDQLEKLYVVMYDDGASHILVTKSNMNKVISDLQNVRGDNCTSFTNMFMVIDKIARENVLDDFVIYIFSDGKHEPSKRDGPLFDSMKQQLITLLKNRPGKSWVKTRAFSQGVDVQMMGALSSFGSEPGDFKYANSVQELTALL